MTVTFAAYQLSEIHGDKVSFHGVTPYYLTTPSAWVDHRHTAHRVRPSLYSLSAQTGSCALPFPHPPATLSAPQTHSGPLLPSPAEPCSAAEMSLLLAPTTKHTEHHKLHRTPVCILQPSTPGGALTAKAARSAFAASSALASASSFLTRAMLSRDKTCQL